MVHEGISRNIKRISASQEIVDSGRTDVFPGKFSGMIPEGIFVEIIEEVHLRTLARITKRNTCGKKSYMDHRGTFIAITGDQFRIPLTITSENSFNRFQ